MADETDTEFCDCLVCSVRRIVDALASLQEEPLVMSGPVVMVVSRARMEVLEDEGIEMIFPLAHREHGVIEL